MLLLAALLPAIALGCGRRDGEGRRGEPWPPRLELPGVLGYLALTAPAEDLSTLGEALLAWRPAGLAESRPLLLAALDDSVLGGPAALLMPVEDEAAFRASLEAAPTVTVLDERRLRLDLPPGHRVLQMLRAVTRATAAGSPMELLAALGEPRGESFPLALSLEEGWAALAPSPEALVLARRLRQALPGLDDAGGTPLVASLDVERCRTVFRAELEGAQARLRAALTGARAAGLAGLLAGASGDGPLSSASLPMSGEALWALVEMFSPRGVEALQLSLPGWPPEAVGAMVRRLAPMLGGHEGGDGPGGPTLPAVSGREVLRVVYGADAPQGAVLACLRAAPAPQAGATLAFDPGRLPAALAAWMRPLATVVKGEGPPCERFLDELAALLEPLDGRVALVGGAAPVLAFSVAPGRRVDRQAVARWLAVLADGTGWKGPGASRRDAAEPPGAEEGARLGVIERAGLLALTGRSDDATLEALLDQAELALRAPAQEGDAVLRLRLPVLTADLRVAPGEVRLESLVHTADQSFILER